MEQFMNKLYQGDFYGMAKDGINVVKQKHILEYTLQDDDSIIPAPSNNKPGWYVVRQHHREGNLIHTGLTIHVPRNYELILLNKAGDICKFESGPQDLVFQMKEEVASENNNKVAYIRICHYPDFEMKQKF